MFKTYISVAVAAALALSAGGALAANNTASITITGTTAVNEDVSGLLAPVGKDFVMVDNTKGNYFQLGNFFIDVSKLDLLHPDYWQWNSTNKSWDMYATQGKSLELTLANVSGHGDPDLSLGLYAYNNSGNNQTYNFSVSSIISPVVSSAYTASATFNAVNMSGGNPTIAATQTFKLFDVASNSVNPGVDISAAGFGSFSASASHLNNAVTFNSMTLSTQFTLSGASGSSSALVTSFASITPVPEPESYAMMLSGLALLAGMAFRRKF
jgi:hypothetical protein